MATKPLSPNRPSPHPQLLQPSTASQFPGVEPTKKPQAGSPQMSGPGWRPALLRPRRQDTSIAGSPALAKTSHQAEAQ